MPEQSWEEEKETETKNRLEAVREAFGGREGFEAFFDEGREHFGMFFQREGDPKGPRIGTLLREVFETAEEGEEVKSEHLEKIHEILKEGRLTHYLKEGGHSPFAKAVDLEDRIRVIMLNEISYLINTLGEDKFKEILNDVFGLDWMLSWGEEFNLERLFRRGPIQPKFIEDIKEWEEIISELPPEIEEKLELDLTDIDGWLENCNDYVHNENKFLEATGGKIDKKREKRRKILKKEMLILGYIAMFIFLSATIAELEYYDKREDKESIMGDLRKMVVR